MRLIIPIIFIALIFAAGYIMGMYSGSASSKGPKLSRPERKELSELRSLKSTVRSTASSHMELEPNFARIILDEVDKTDKAVDTIRNS